MKSIPLSYKRQGYLFNEDPTFNTSAPILIVLDPSCNLTVTELVLESICVGNAITWQPELVTHLLVASTFIGSAYVLSEKAHVSMEWIYDFFK